MSIRPGVYPPSPPASVARSSVGTNTHQMSMSSSNSGGGRKYSTQVFEEQLAEHHAALKEFLSGELRDDKTYQPHHRARDKLLRLSAIQFQELSTDVYDELLRREDERQAGGSGANSNAPRFLLPKNNFHPKRNQARQKLSTLPVKKFRELSTDVLYELERRYPRFGINTLDRMVSASGNRDDAGSRPATSNGMPPLTIRRPSTTEQGPYSPGIFETVSNSTSPSEYGRLLPKTFQSNTLIPNKSTMVEDDDSPNDDEGENFDASRFSRRTTNKSLPYSLRDEKPANEYQQEVERLEAKVDQLEALVRDKDDEIREARKAESQTLQTLDTERNRASDLRSDLEHQLETAKNLNNSIQVELDKMRASHATLQNDFLEQSRAGNKAQAGDWQKRYEDLERDYHEQQQITDEVRREALHSLQEMRTLSERSLQATEGEDKLLKQVNQLESEVNEWKSRYARTKTQLRSLRATSIGLHIQQQTAGQYAKDANFTDPNGLVKDVHVTKFQIAIDELLHLTRNSEPSSALDYMRTIVKCVKNVTQDIGQSQASADDEAAKQRLKLKSKVSAAANNLITAAKNFSASNGLSPVSLVDAAASHLTNAVVDLIRNVKIRPTSADELEDDDDGGSPPVASGNMPFGQRTARGSHSTTSAASSPTSPKRQINGWGSSTIHNRNNSFRGANGQSSPLYSRSASSAYNGDGGHQDSELKDYLEELTAALVHTIQPFVQSIRAASGGSFNLDNINTHVKSIATIVSDVVQKVESATSEDSSERTLALRKHALPIVDELARCRSGLLDAQTEAANAAQSERGRHIVKEKMPPLAFKIARSTKILLGKVDDVDRGDLTSAQEAAPLDA